MGGAVLICPRDDGHDLGRCCGSGQRTVFRIEQRLPLQQDAGDPKQPVGDAAKRTTVGVPAPAQGVVAAAAFGVALHGDAGPVEHGLT